MSQLTRRVDALEAVLRPAGPIICFMAMNGVYPMTEQEIEKEIGLRKAGAPANARIVLVTWLSPSDVA